MAKRKTTKAVDPAGEIRVLEDALKSAKLSVRGEDRRARRLVTIGNQKSALKDRFVAKAGKDLRETAARLRIDLVDAERTIDQALEQVFEVKNAERVLRDELAEVEAERSGANDW
jgi:hypothetical protein